jgi:hypothetical protein
MPGEGSGRLVLLVVQHTKRSSTGVANRQARSTSRAFIDHRLGSFTDGCWGIEDPRRFEGQTVIVTGAGRGIGQSIAVRFAREGAELLVVGRTPAPLEETAGADSP